MNLQAGLGTLEHQCLSALAIRSKESPRETNRQEVRARDLWSTGLAVTCAGVELGENVASVGLERGPFPPQPEPWTDAELKLLEGILLSEKDPFLRDAASLVLAGRHRSQIEVVVSIRVMTTRSPALAIR